MFRQLAVGRDLAAEHRQQRRAALVIDVENIVARDGGGIAGAVVTERAHAGKAGDNVGAREARPHEAIDDAQEVVALVILDR